MSVELSPHLALWGATFSPAACEVATGLALTNKNEPGEVGRDGRPIPNGSAHLVPPGSVGLEDCLAWLAGQAAPHSDTFTRLGAESCVLHLDVCYRDQCNLEFSSEELAAIAALGMPFTISCWDGSEEPQVPQTPSRF